MKKIGPRTLSALRGRILDIHPALLPKYGGRGMHGEHVHEAVLRNGESVTGISIHVVDGEYDTGPVVASMELPVLAGDTVTSLAERVRCHERDFLVGVLADLARGGGQPEDPDLTS